MARETAEFLIQTLKEAYPNVDTRIGTVPRDWLITPMSILLEPYEAQRANIGTRQLIENYETLTDEEMDDLASNLFIYRNLGVRARADIILGFSQPTSVTVDAGTIVENADGTKQYTVVNTFSASRATVGGNQQADGLYYTAPIATQATEPGETQVAQADELVYMPFPPVGLERVTNPSASLWGAARETNTELYSRILAAISARQIMNVPGTEGVLLARFRHIEEILLVGTGHELMDRDETFSYTDLSGSLLPIASMYGKVRGDGTNKNRALRLTTTVAVPATPSTFAVEVSQTEYQGLGVLDDSEVARLDTGLILSDPFATRPAFQEAEALLTLDANATSDITVANAAFFGVGDLVEVLDDDTDAVRRTVLSVGASTLSLSETVASLTTAQNALVRKVPRPSDVGNGWIESSHGQRLGTEAAGIQTLVEDGVLRFKRLNSVADTDIEDALKDLFKEALADGGYSVGAEEDIETEVDNLSLTDLVADVQANVTATVSPVVQRPIPQQNGLRIRGQLTTTDSSTDGKLMFILTRKKSTGTASYFYGFGAALRRSVASATTTTTTADTAADDGTIMVSSTASFASSGALVIGTTTVTYTGKTPLTFTGCVGTPATSTGATVAASKNTLFIVDGGDLGSSENNHLVANDTPIAADTDYWFELLITPPNVAATSSASATTELRIWLDDDTTVRPTDPTLSYGSYIPTSARNNVVADTHFGISVYDNDQYEWSFDSLRIDSIAPVYPHYLYRFDATDFSDRFKVQVKGRAWGEDDDALAYGMTVRLWNDTDSAWEEIGDHTEGTAALIESATSHSVMTYNDSNNFIWVMVSGDHPWGLAAASVLEVDYAAIIDDGVEGVHVGGKADIYVRSEGGILPSTVDLDGVDQLEVLNDETGFTLPIASIDAIFLLDGAGRPTGGALQEGVDYTLAVVNPNLRYSAHEQIALTFSPDVQASSVRVFYSNFQFMEDIQAFMESGDQRLATADVLARAFLPAYVTVTIEMSGYTITDEAMRRGLVAFVNNAKRSIEPSDLINEAYRLGATSVETDLTVTVEKHALDGSKTTTTLTSRMELAENERFYARAVNVIRI